jgi:hypothetical protein
MTFRAIAVRVVEEFFIIFRNNGPMFHAIHASACRAIEGSPEVFEVVEPGGVRGRQASP